MSKVESANAEPVVSLVAVEVAAKNYAVGYDLLRNRVEALQVLLDQAKRRALPGIKSALADAAKAKLELKHLVEQCGREGKFEKPRTVIFHGVKVGLAKGKGKIEWDDEEMVIKLIRKHLPELAETLIVENPKVAKSALKNVAVSDLKRIGCRVVDADDQVVIDMVDGDADKLVTALLADAETEKN